MSWIRKKEFRELLKILRIVCLRFDLRRAPCLVDWPVGGNTLVILPHPDDEAFGLGGLLSHSAAGITLVYLTRGERSLPEYPAAEVGGQRQKLRQQVVKLLGVDEGKVFQLDFPDGALPQPGDRDYPLLFESLKEIIEREAIGTILAPSDLEFWPVDHLAAAKVADDLSSQLGLTLYYYWVWTWYHLGLRRFRSLRRRRLLRFDCRQEMAGKQRLIGIYLNSFAPDGRPWSGCLPRAFLAAFRYPYEILEQVR